MIGTQHKAACYVPINRWMALCAVRKDLTMKLTDLIVSPKSLGDKLWLVDVSPAYEYQNNRRTDTVLGYRYSIAMPERGLDKVDVRIDGQQQMDAPNGYEEVRFDNLEVFIYWSKGDYHVGARKEVRTQ